jgi:hypothetical protein
VHLGLYITQRSPLGIGRCYGIDYIGNCVHINKKGRPTLGQAGPKNFLFAD